MSAVKVKPLGDRVLIKHADEDEQVRDGIIIPDSAKEKPQEAEVIALGTGSVQRKSWRSRSHKQVWRQRSKDRWRNLPFGP